MKPHGTAQRSRTVRDDGNGIAYNESGITYGESGQTYGGVTRDESGIPIGVVLNQPIPRSYISRQEVPHV